MSTKPGQVQIAMKEIAMKEIAMKGLLRKDCYQATRLSPSNLSLL
ncbi:hypothetical protein [Salinibacter altiplanensis]|nr:hypothetical protein [Salinibacter altiplanensis]